MSSLLQFHALAAARGEGLRPELVTLFTNGATVSQSAPTIPDRSRSGADELPDRLVTLPADLSQKWVVETCVGDAGYDRVPEFEPDKRDARRVQNG